MGERGGKGRLVVVVVPVHGRIAERLGDVGSKLAKVVAGRRVVANGEERRNVRGHVTETVGTVALAGAVNRGTSNRRGALPNNLGVVTIPIEGGVIVDVVGRGLAVKAGKVVDLAVVEEIGDDGGDVVFRCTSSDVLAIAATTSLHVVGVVAAVGNLERNAGKVAIPGYVAG